jgi:glycogen synthase
MKVSTVEVREMKIYEYAKKRNIKSKDVVSKLHQLGFDHIKNHLSLVPEKILDVLDETEFEIKGTKKKKAIKQGVMISLECAPFINRGLGDVIRHKLLHKKAQGDLIKVILPRYQLDQSELNFQQDLSITIGNEVYQAQVYTYVYEETTYYFIHHELFNRDQLLGYKDDLKRLAFFNHAALELFNGFIDQVDVVSIFEWPLGLFPVLFKEQHQQVVKPKIEFVTLGATYQGIYGPEDITDVFGLNPSLVEDGTITHAKSVNLLKAGLVTADQVDLNKMALENLKNSYLKEYVYDNM